MFEALQNREIIFEFHQMGNLIKVSAMDVKTLTEVIIQAPANASEQIMKHNAMKRMEFVLRKKGEIT